MRLSSRPGRVLLGALCATAVASAVPACYTAGGGTAPPGKNFYFPVGLAVSSGGRVLYAVNSDFDLQWSGGTLQSYDLEAIRADAAALVAYNGGFLKAGDQFPLSQCLSARVAGSKTPPGVVASTGFTSLPSTLKYPPRCLGPGATLLSGAALGASCSPPVDSTKYVTDHVVVGAFATDLQIAPGGPDPTKDRLFFPVRGTATLTYADVGHDDPSQCLAPQVAAIDPRHLLCDPRDSTGRCSGAFQVGSDPNILGNTRHVTMPGEPFGMALTQDWTAVAITHQTDTKTSLLTSGIDTGLTAPTMQFVLDGLPQGGNGIAYVPHDYDAVTACDDPRNAGVSSLKCLRPAFLQTSRNVAEIDLLRYYSDVSLTLPNSASGAGLGETLQRPFLQRERAYGLTANSLGTDQRGIAIDPTPRVACKAKLGANPSADALKACGQIPARVFFASRSPPSLVIGEIGELAPDGSYDADQLVVTGNVSVDSGPSRVYLAPVIDAQGFFELKVFVVCFDSSDVFIYDAESLGSLGSQAVPDKVIYTGSGTGPFAMAFDPMPLECAAIADPNSDVWKTYPSADYPWRTTKCPSIPAPSASVSALGPYRFGYIANFTQSFVQMIDLDASSPYAPYAFENIVFTLGQPTLPKGQ